MKTIPKYKHLVYRMNDHVGYYETRTAPPGFTKLPYDLKVEETQRKDIIKADNVIRGRLKNGKYTYFTGLRPASVDQWFTGDHSELYKGKRSKSLVLFNFSPDNTMLNVYFFPGYYKFDPKRINTFVETFTDFLQRS
jgi:hypothetical protein